MKTIQLAAIALLGFGMSVTAQDKPSVIAEALKGKLIEVKDGKIEEAELKGSPEFYVLYYSASW